MTKQQNLHKALFAKVGECKVWYNYQWPQGWMLDLPPWGYFLRIGCNYQQTLEFIEKFDWDTLLAVKNVCSK